MKKTAVLFLVVIMMLAFASAASAAGKVVLYSSLQEAQLQALEEAFEFRHPDVDLVYCYAGNAKLIAKMTVEAEENGQICCDVIWTGDRSDYEAFKANGWLAPYVSPEAAHIPAVYSDPEGYYTAARMVTMGIAWNIGLVDESEAPRTWNDLLDPRWQNQIIMTDPSQASTTKYWMAAMMQSPKYGESYFEALKANGLELESGTTATHNRVADASYEIGICMDYVSVNLIADGSPMEFRYTDDDVVVMTTPVAMISGCANEENARLLIDFILSKDGQEVLVNNSLVSVRDDIEWMLDTSGLAAACMEVDYIDLAANRDSYAETFAGIFEQ